jgi:hypothetical protein
LPDRQFILDGVLNGFHIVNIEDVRTDTYVDIRNYKSATELYHKQVEDQIKSELANDHYIQVAEMPNIISAIGAIPKKDTNKIRIIHDCSRPEGGSVNSFANTEKFSYQTIQDAVDKITPNCYLAKIDLANAYRSVKIHRSNYRVTGLKWKFVGDKNDTIMVDTRLSYGAARSPQIFNKLTQAVCKIMEQKFNSKIVVFLDDFLLIAEHFQECLSMINNLVALLRKLGFSINYNKMEGPTQRITYLGIVLDTTAMTLELPPKTLTSFREDLYVFKHSQKTTKQKIQSILGKLNWATQCIYGGKFFVRRLIDRMAKLKKPWHRTWITREMKNDVDWWLNFLETFNGTMPMVDIRPAAPVCIDACNVGAGGYFMGLCVYTPWKAWPEAASLHINMKEVLALEPAAHQWAHLWRNKKIYVHTDNQAAAGIINKCMSKDPIVMDSLRRIYWLSVTYNFRLRAIYYPGKYNIIADSVSRLHEPMAIQRLNDALNVTCIF